MAIIYGRAESEKELLKNYPNEVTKIEDIPKMHEYFKDKLNEEDTGWFAGIRKWNKQRQVNKFENNKDNLFQPGAKGELQVLEKLSQLSDDYHVLCGLNIALPYSITYNGRKNLRSAQMDFVVVSKRGVIVMEVKNWSDQYANQKHRLRPHEQVDRAGLVLWIALKSSWWSPKNPPVIKVLLSIQGNIKYDPGYKYVSVTDLNKINNFIENRQERFSDKDVKKMVDRIKDYVTR